MAKINYGFEKYNNEIINNIKENKNLDNIKSIIQQKMNELNIQKTYDIEKNDYLGESYEEEEEYYNENEEKNYYKEENHYESVKRMIEEEKNTYVKDKDKSKNIKETKQTKKNLNKKGKLMAREMREYMELIEDSLYDEVFDLLEKNAIEIKDSIEQKRYVRSILNGLFDDENFSIILHEDRWGELASSLSIALQKPFFSDIKNRLNTVLNIEEASKLVSVLLLENKIEAAETFMPHANKDLSIYNSTIDGIISSNNTKALRFVCENFENIHYNSGELLIKAVNMKPESLKLLIDDFEFDINSQNKLDKTLVTTMITENNLKNFEWLNKNYGDKINYANSSILTLIEKTGKTDFYSIILDNQNLKLPQLEKIGEFLFAPKNIEKYTQTDLYEKLFLHKKFDEQIFNLGQEYFLYGLFSKMGLASKKEGNDSARNYLRILDTYLNSTSIDSVPDTPEFHIVGVAVHVAKIGECQSVTDACTLIMRRFGQYINKPNPSGVLPIEQIEKESPLYRILINNGAVPPEPPATFWNNVFNVFKKKKEPPQVIQQQVQESNVNSSSSISSIRVKMRNDFRTMQEYLTIEECDPAIKMKCENMFLKADKLSMVMDRNSLTSFTDELHFLSENFSNYLKQSLKAYTDLIHTTQRLDNEEQSKTKIDRAKKMCLSHVDLLNEQLDLITTNISNGLSDGAMSQLKVRSKFLENRFNSSIEEEEDTQNIVQILDPKKDKEEVVKNVVSIINENKESNASSEKTQNKAIEIDLDDITNDDYSSEKMTKENMAKKKIKL